MSTEYCEVGAVSGTICGCSTPNRFYPHPPTERHVCSKGPHGPSPHECSCGAEWTYPEDVVPTVLSQFLRTSPGELADDWALVDNLADDDARELAKEAIRLLTRVIALHPRRRNVRHACCAAPQLCNEPHHDECDSRDHGVYKPAWPCPTLRAIGVEQ